MDNSEIIQEARESGNLVLQFSDGDPVPDWLILATPSRPDSVPGTVTFGTKGAVFSLEARYVVSPDDPAAEQILVIADSQYMDYRASTADLILPKAAMMLVRADG